MATTSKGRQVDCQETESLRKDSECGTTETTENCYDATDDKGDEQFLQKSVDKNINTQLVSLSHSLQNMSRDGVSKQPPVRKLVAYDWIVLVSAFLSVTIASGVIGCMSIFYVEFLHTFSNSKAEIALVPSLANGMYNIGGVFAGVMVDHLGCRTSMIIGSLLISVTSAICFMSPNIYFLIVLLGLFCAFGTSIVMLSGMVLVGQQFGTEHPIGTIIISASYSSALILFAQIMPMIIDKFGWRGALLVWSSITLHIIPFGLISTYGMSKKQKKRLKGVDTEERISSKRCSKLGLFDTKLLRNGALQLFVVAIGISTSATSFLNFMLIVDFGKNRGFSLMQSSSLLTIMGIGSLISRVLTALLKMLKNIKNIYMCIVFSLLAAILDACVPLSTNYWSLVTIIATFGICIGLRYSFVLLSLMDLLPMENYAQALGYSLTVWGISIVLVGPIVGEMSTITGSYDLSYYIGGLVGGLSLIPLSVYVYFKGWSKGDNKVDCGP